MPEVSKTELYSVPVDNPSGQKNEQRTRPYLFFFLALSTFFTTLIPSTLPFSSSPKTKGCRRGFGWSGAGIRSITFRSQGFGPAKSRRWLRGAKNASQIHKKHVALFSLEMSNEQLVQRLLSQETSIDSQRLRLANLRDDEWPLFTQAVSALSDTHIYLDDTPAITPLQLRTKCRRLHMEIGLDLIIVDYLQLMTGDSRIDNRVQEVSYISRSLKGLARELNVPVLAAAQLSRAVESRRPPRPILSDLRESGSLEQDADVVMFIYRPDQYEEDTLKQNIAEIIVAKHRNGPVGSVELVFRQSLAKFENAATRQVDLAAGT